MCKVASLIINKYQCFKPLQGRKKALYLRCIFRSHLLSFKSMLESSMLLNYFKSNDLLAVCSQDFS